MSISKITPFLWFTAPQAFHAAKFYVDLFDNNPFAKEKEPSTIVKTTNYPSAQPEDPDDSCKFPDAGSVLTVDFTLNGQTFIALNGNKEGSEMPWKFNESISFSISCNSQEEVDYFWDALTSNGGTESQCGWCKDRWGVCWQVVPKQMGQLMGDSDPAAKERVTKRMYTMKKIDIGALEAAQKAE